jgi:hypothetical protein
MHTIDALPFLKIANANPRELLSCPKCSKKFTAESGVVFTARYLDKGQVKSGLLTFCDTTCLLGWEDLEDLGHG